ncbi:hypothetical protein AOQ84DRAFT_392069 [Glonium stellatum]|uniref:N-acetyltransferase domain-containing protein n=1 Tax=Glonium stellatum TaxID=574774 RepID=A0A8E2ESA8_9PEZI|nr:hypothetical protein AOQ84DRAFT_392069 [Glonium stellatum]
MASRDWHRTFADKRFFISTSLTLLSHDFLQTAFEDAAMYWTKAMSPLSLQLMLENSCTFGLYIQDEQRDSGGEPAFTQIGIARIITDYVTFAYLTDVYIQADFRALGLGRWLIACCKEVVEDMPELRRFLLLTGSEQAIQFYREQLGMDIFGREAGGLVVMSVRKDNLQAVGRKENTTGPN